MHRLSFDGFVFGEWQGFEPKWWQLRRWIRWFLTEPKCTIYVEIDETLHPIRAIKAVPELSVSVATENLESVDSPFDY